ncbi:unnamed protein product, partial [marine sediment metagenome]
YEFENFSRPTFENLYKKMVSSINLKNMLAENPDEETFKIYTDLNNYYLGGISVSRKTIEQTKANILDFAMNQLSRQVMETLATEGEELKFE